jgi:hypothetical protein
MACRTGKPDMAYRAASRLGLLTPPIKEVTDAVDTEQAARGRKKTNIRKLGIGRSCFDL